MKADLKDRISDKWPYLGSLLLLLLMGIFIFIAVIWKPNNTDGTAETCEQLEIYAKFPDDIQKIKLWQSEEGIFYAFLPSGKENYNVSFGNIGENTTIRLGDEEYTGQDNIDEKLQYGQPYEMELSGGNNDADGKSGQIVFMKSEGLPSLYITTASGSMDYIHSSREIKEGASIVLRGEGGDCLYADDIEYIKTRGNTSFDFEKKPYQIRLKQEASILGMPEAQKWILITNEIDDSMLKNELVYRYTEKYTDLLSIKGKYVDLYLNNDYRGTYYLCEKIEIDENRVDITDLESETENINYDNSYQNAQLYVSEDKKVKATLGLNNPEDITGGYLVEYVPDYKYEEASINAFQTELGYYYDIVSPNPATVEQVEYIRGQFNEMEQAIIQEDGINPVTGKHFSEYLDVDSWTWKYLIEEVFHDADAGSASMFFYKDSDSVDAHIYSGPMWDYDKSLGHSGNAPDYREDDPEYVGNFGLYVNELMRHEEIREDVYNKFSQYIVPYEENLFKADIYNLRRSIEMSEDMNQIRWPENHGYYSDYEASCNYLASYLEKRVDFLKEVWLQDEGYCRITFLDSYGSEYIRYNVKRGEYLEHIPTIASYVAVFNGWYSVDDGRLLDPRLPVWEDKTYESRWIDINIILENGLNAAELDAAEADPEVFRELADLLEERQNESEE